MNQHVRDQVHAIVRLVPAGRVVSYGDIAGMLGIGPRQVGRAMAVSGPADELPWWRVTSHAGDPPKALRAQAFEHWASERIEVKPNGLGCRIGLFRADLAALADAAEDQLGALPGLSD